VHRHRRGAPAEEIECPAAMTWYQEYMDAVDRGDRCIADWTVSCKTGRWYMQLFFRAIDTVVHNMYIIQSFWTGKDQRDERYGAIYAKYEQGRHTHGVRMTFQLHLARSLIEYAEEGALGEAGGNRTRVSWLRQRQSRSDTTPSPAAAQRGRPPKHSFVDVTGRPFCQVCRMVAQQQLHPSHELRNACSLRKCDVALPAMWSCAGIAVKTTGTMRRAA